MLPSDSPAQCSGCGVYGSWPASGEIDIMEAVNDMNTAFGTLHYGGPSGQKYASYWTHGPGQYSGSPLTQVCRDFLSCIKTGHCDIGQGMSLNVLNSHATAGG